VKRESSGNLELTRSGKERRDECLVQTLLVNKVGSPHPNNATKSEDLPEYVAIGSIIACYRSRLRHP